MPFVSSMIFYPPMLSYLECAEENHLVSPFTSHDPCLNAPKSFTQQKHELASENLGYPHYPITVANEGLIIWVEMPKLKIGKVIGRIHTLTCDEKPPVAFTFIHGSSRLSCFTAASASGTIHWAVYYKSLT